MASSSVYYIVHKKDIEYLKLSIETMVSYEWVKNILILHTDEEKPEYFGQFYVKYNPKIKEAWKFFGEGLDIPLEEGGMNQTLCRNTAVNLAKMFGNKWIIKCDADEFYTPLLGEILNDIDNSNMTKGKPVALWLACYHFLCPSVYFVDNTVMRGNMYDAHICVWTSNASVQYMEHNKGPNKTQHCYAMPTTYGTIQLQDPRICHVHVHHMLGHKTKCGHDRERRLIDISPKQIFKQHYIDAYIDYIKGKMA